MNFDKKILTGVLVLALSLVAVGVGASVVNQPDKSDPTTEVVDDANVQAGDNVFVYKNGELVAKTHNTLMEGKEAVEEQLKTGESINYDQITLGHGSAPGLGDGTLDTEWASCGLSPATGSFTDNGDGNWTLSHTFTSSCDDVIVNTTAQWSSGAGATYDYFAGTDFGRNINLYNGDQLTVKWTNSVS